MTSKQVGFYMVVIPLLIGFLFSVIGLIKDLINEHGWRFALLVLGTCLWFITGIGLYLW